jgi:hypothetical protein
MVSDPVIGNTGWRSNDYFLAVFGARLHGTMEGVSMQWEICQSISLLLMHL